MGGIIIFLLKWTTYASVFCFATVCLATGLYYIAEIVEDYEKTTRKVIRYTIWSVLGIHVAVFLFEDIPWHLIAIGIISHIVYLAMLPSFPNIRTKSVIFIASAVMCLLSQIVWFHYLRSAYMPFEEVCAYFLMLVWLVPFIYFISISSNDTALPYGATISATGELVEGEKGRHNFVHNIAQYILQAVRGDHSSPLDTRQKYR